MSYLIFILQHFPFKCRDVVQTHIVAPPKTCRCQNLLFTTGL